MQRASPTEPAVQSDVLIIQPLGLDIVPSVSEIRANLRLEALS